jgi:hypothetical protein
LHPIGNGDLVEVVAIERLGKDLSIPRPLAFPAHRIGDKQAQ